VVGMHLRMPRQRRLNVAQDSDNEVFRLLRHNLSPIAHAHRAVFHNCAAGTLSQPNA
jgi:hypothetical protein